MSQREPYAFICLDLLNRLCREVANLKMAMSAGFCTLHEGIDKCQECNKADPISVCPVCKKAERFAKIGTLCKAHQIGCMVRAGVYGMIARDEYDPEKLPARLEKLLVRLENLVVVYEKSPDCSKLDSTALAKWFVEDALPAILEQTRSTLDTVKILTKDLIQSRAILEERRASKTGSA